MATYMAVRPSNAGTAIRAVFKEYDDIIRGELSREELRATKEQLKGRILLGLETSTARMMQMAQNELNYCRQINEKELIRRIDSITLDDVIEVANHTLSPQNLSVVSLGPSGAGLNA